MRPAFLAVTGVGPWLLLVAAAPNSVGVGAWGCREASGSDACVSELAWETSEATTA